MSVTGLCDVCEDRTAAHSCPQCGAVVCEKHFDEEFEVCLRCAPAGETRPDSPSPEDDFDTFQL